jgi:putative hemolysin
MINVEHILHQHLPGLTSTQPWLTSFLGLFLRIVLRENDLVRFTNEYPHLQGIDFIEQILDYFRFDYQLRMTERHHIPSSGPAVIVANHPLGSLDGLVLLKMVHEIRPDVKVVANQLLQQISPLHKLLLPVNNMQGSTSGRSIRSIYDFLSDGGILIIFPAGEVSRLGPNGVHDSRWNPGFLRMAQMSRAPIIPVHMNGRNSSLFYGLSIFCRPLSTLWLIREMFKQKDHVVSIRIGQPVHFDTYSSLPVTRTVAAQLFRKHVYQLGRNRQPVLKTEPPVALPENRQQVRNAVRSGDFIGETPDGKQIWLHHCVSDSPMMREIARLREISFRAVGEGCRRLRDMDRFDMHYDHMLLWDDAELEIIGAYRWFATASIPPQAIANGQLYTNELFSFDGSFNTVLQSGLELGRSFIQPRFWRSRGLDYLWHGIGAYLRTRPDIRYLFGPVSISQKYPAEAIEMIIWYYSNYFKSSLFSAEARLPYRLHPSRERYIAGLFTGNDITNDFRLLKDHLRIRGMAVPPLYKQYSHLCESGGVSFLDFNIDPAFGHCIDGLVVVDLQKLTPDKYKRYISGPG